MPSDASPHGEFPDKTLDTLLEQNAEILLKVRSVFPFKLFPTTVTIDRTKVVIMDRVFFFSKISRTLPIKDIGTVVVETGFPFASLRMTSKLPNHDSLTVTHLWENQADKARRIIDGLILADRESVDILQVPQEELESKLEEVASTPLNPRMAAA